MATYIALIRKEKDSAFGVEFPDFPGCISAGDTLDEAVAGAKDALELHVDGMLEDGEDIPDPSGLEVVKKLPEYKGAVPVIIDVPVVRRNKRVNITMDEGLLEKVDGYASESGTSRSGLLTEAARKYIRTPYDEDLSKSEMKHFATMDVTRAFVLGAGFSSSVYDKFPDASKLMSLVKKIDKKIEVEENFFETFFGGYAMLRGQDNYDIISALTALTAYLQVFPEKLVEEKILRFRTRLLFALGSLLKDLSEEAAKSPVLEKFLIRLDPERDAIVTMNWDTVLEHGLDRLRIPWMYGGPEPHENQNKVLVFKPHGSINFFRTDIKHGGDFGPIHRDVPQIAEWKKLKTDIYPKFGQQRQRTVPRDIGDPFPDPAITPPGFIRLEEESQQWMYPFLQWSANAILNAEKIVVVGYRIPEDDISFSVILSYCAWQDFWGFGKRLYVIDPSLETLERWKKVVQNKVKVEHLGKYLDEAMEAESSAWDPEPSAQG